MLVNASFPGFVMELPYSICRVIIPYYSSVTVFSNNGFQLLNPSVTGFGVPCEVNLSQDGRAG